MSGLAFAPKLALSEPNPGIAGQLNSLGVSRAEPFTTVYFTYGTAAGLTPVPTCPGFFVESDNATVFGPLLTDANGDGTLVAPIPAGAAGLPLHLQAVQLNPCERSNLLVLAFS